MIEQIEKNFYGFFSFFLWSSTEKIGIFEVINAHWDQFDPIEIINRETNTVSGKENRQCDHVCIERLLCSGP